MEGIIMTIQLLLGLSLLVGLHELGHLLAAKAFGMRVEKYSIGFPPKIWGRQFGETEYSIGMIPLGGFVKISGMIDESLDTKMLSAEPEPWEFRAKPAWQRLIVMMGGIIVNVITGIIIFISLVYTKGETYVTKDELNKHGIVAYELGEMIGLKTGDKIININGNDFEKLNDVSSGDVLLSTNGYYTIERNGQKMRIDIPANFVDYFSDRDRAASFVWVRRPFSVAKVTPGSNAEKGGLKDGDKFIAIAGVPVTYFDELNAALDTLRGKVVEVDVLRNKVSVNLSLQVTPEGTLGFQIEDLLNFAKVEYGFLAAIPVGTAQAFNFVWINVKAFRKMFSGDVSVSKSLSGPIGIAKVFGGKWDWLNFWQITGLLSMILAFMNFLPIPALDGGHVMFLTWEIVTGIKPSDRFLENAQKVGMVLLLGLMSFAIFNDIVKLF